MESLKNEIELLFSPENERLKFEIIESINDVYKNIKSKKDLIDLGNKFDWVKVIKLFDREFEKLYKTFGVNTTQSGIFANKIQFRKRLLAELKNQIILNILMSNEKNYVISLNQDINKQIIFIMNKYYIQHFIETMDKENLRKEFRKADAFLKRKFGKGNKELYEKIFQKNDEYIDKDGEGNFSKATRIVLKNSSTWRTKFKAFNKFKNKNKIYTYEDYKNYLSTI